MKSVLYWRWIVIIGVVLVGLLFLSPVLYERGLHFLVTGQFFPIDKIDELQTPIDVQGWSQDGLLLADGRTIMLPGLTSLPETSVALRVATEQGVEVSPDGRIYGLVKIHHWCGCDPVRNHIAKVDLAHMLMVLREGEPKSALAELMFGNREASGFSEWGWNISDYLRLQHFEETLPHEAILLESLQSRPGH